ncbi:MAG: ankyrin repeat domain-containing protein, partial [Rhodospirillaceae bacterium]|nr:ankyrin repeat domain-containing protein [Rhodospirillaceae bacterium]
MSAQEQFDTDYATKVLFMAVDKNDLPGVRAAIEGGANVEAVNTLGMQAVDIAVDRGYYDIAHYLISVRTLLAEKAKNNPPVAQAIAPTPAPAEEWAARVTAPNETIVVEAPTETPAESQTETLAKPLAETQTEIPAETVVAVTPAPKPEGPKPEAPKPELPVVEKVEPQTLVAEAPMPKEIATPPVPLPRPTITPAIAPTTEETKAVADVVAPKIEPEIITEVTETAEPKAVEEVKEEVIEIAEAPTTEPAPAPVEPIKSIEENIEPSVKPIAEPIAE